MNDFYRRLHKIELIALNSFRYRLNRKKSRYILVDTPVHGNLGDQAITVSEFQFLKKILGPNSFFEITYDEIGKLEKEYSKIVPNDSTILLQGGGFLGSLWPNEELRVRSILRAFHKHKIIVFPQTVFFQARNSYYEESKRVYTENPNIYFFVREKNSYNVLQKMGCRHVLFCPDMVCNLDVPNAIKNNLARKGVLLGLRDDKEKLFSPEDENVLKDMLNDFGYFQIKKTTNVVNKIIRANTRREEVLSKLTEISNAQIVITDRLHLMLFSAITNTPCIAFDNRSGKVKGVYQTIQNNQYIQFANNLDELADKIKTIQALKEPYCYKLEYEYNNLESIILDQK